MLLIRCILSCLFWVTVARWGYLELNIFYPDAIPLVDSIVEQLTPPTHDMWPDVEVGIGEDKQISLKLK